MTSLDFDAYNRAHSRTEGMPHRDPVTNHYPVAKCDLATVPEIVPGTLVFALRAFGGALKGRFMGVTVDAYGERALRVQLTGASRNGYHRGETIAVRPDDVFLRSARHYRNHAAYFSPEPLLFVAVGAL